MTIELPNELIGKPAYSEQEFKLDIAITLYQRKVLTLARAARWAGLSRLQFQKAIADRDIPLNYTKMDIEIDLQTIKSMPR
jgi:predicted HTH domain antitoxin